MAAYLLVDCKVSDAAKYEGYKLLAQAAVARYGGRFLVRGGEAVRLEGEWEPNRVIVVEFPSLAQARSFYDSVEYREARAARQGAARLNMVAVAGV
jgi:uncharacterized protein (DUF1330 family)